MKKAMQFAAVLPLCAALFGCGGGSAADSQRPADAGSSALSATEFHASGSQRLADGAWVGTDRDGKPAFALVSQYDSTRNQFFLATGVGIDNYTGLYSGYLQLHDGDIGGATVLGLSDILDLGLRGHVDAANTFSSEIFASGTGGVLAKYALSYSADNARPADLKQLAGNYSPLARSNPGETKFDATGAQRLSIDGNGRLRGHIPFCELDGYVRSMAAGNLYQLFLTATPESAAHSCLTFDASGEPISLSGLASLVTLPNDKVASLLFATSGFRGGKVQMLSGAIPKQKSPQ